MTKRIVSGGLILIVLIGCSPPIKTKSPQSSADGILIQAAVPPDAKSTIVISPPRNAAVEAIDAAIHELLASDRRLPINTSIGNQLPSNTTSLTLKGKP